MTSRFWQVDDVCSSHRADDDTLEKDTDRAIAAVGAIYGDIYVKMRMDRERMQEANLPKKTAR